MDKSNNANSPVADDQDRKVSRMRYILIGLVILLLLPPIALVYLLSQIGSKDERIEALQSQLDSQPEHDMSDDMGADETDVERGVVYTFEPGGLFTEEEKTEILGNHINILEDYYRLVEDKDLVSVNITKFAQGELDSPDDYRFAAFGITLDEANSGGSQEGGYINYLFGADQTIGYPELCTESCPALPDEIVERYPDFAAQYDR